jgi:Cu(I)/Ag(I) efflux system membrane fusion protein
MRRLIVLSRPGRRNLIIAGLATIALVAAVLAYLTLGRAGEESACPGGQSALYWYDPMVPAEHYPGPGKSSMNMPLQPKCPNGGAEDGVTVSPAMQQNLGIRLAKVEVRQISPLVRAVGHVQFDERLIQEVQTLTPGFVESLSVRAEGEPISAGRVVANVYSPDLLTAENEYRALLTSHSPAAISLRPAARYRLRLLGLSENLIRRLEHGGAPHVGYPVAARESGVVTKIGARPGAQVALGESIVTIQGLSRVLVVADVPEASLGSVHVGQPAEISFPAYAGLQVRGVVDYIFPSLNSQTRTAQLRITLPNPGGHLRQGMFANVTLQGTGGMATVVPSEAVIDTGVRQVVIVKRGGGFIPQEVKIGRDYDQYTEIVAGLQPGEEVVASGQFLIDSEASLSNFISRLWSQHAPQPGGKPGR